MRLLVTRPEPDASRTAEKLAALGHEPILSPMLDIEFDLAQPLPDGSFQAVLVTSSNAVRALVRHPGRAAIGSLPLLSVGDATALEARRAGFAQARSAGGALDDLVALVDAQLDAKGGRLLYAAGDVQAGDLAARLAQQGYAVSTAVLYRSRVRNSLSQPALSAMRDRAVDGVLLHSPRSASAFASAVTIAALAPLPSRFACFCISDRTADAVRDIRPGQVHVADQPNQASLLALLQRISHSAEGVKE